VQRRMVPAGSPRAALRLDPELAAELQLPVTTRSK
jgi:hypothetical protein